MHTLFSLTLAANYLEIQELLDITLKTIANMMKEKNAEEIKQTFAIPPEEQAKIPTGERFGTDASNVEAAKSS